MKFTRNLSISNVDNIYFTNGTDISNLLIVVSQNTSDISNLENTIIPNIITTIKARRKSNTR